MYNQSLKRNSMALISIPTSIGGVSIPGAITGPLSALFGSKYGSSFLQYPRDLSSATRGHVVQFSVNEVNEATYDKAVSAFQPSNDNWFDAAKNTVSGLYDAAKSVNLSLNARTKTNVATISLYMPDTLNFTYAAQYGSTSLLSVGGQVTAPKEGQKPGLISKVISTSQTDAAKLALSTQGLAVNPKMQLLFDGIDFRTYQLAFTFTPYSKEEAQAVKNIVTTFKKYSLPKITKSAAGMFFVIPATFNLKFLYNGAENKNISKVAESVIQNITVDYAPNGWTAHSDGAPVQTTLTLDFKEISLVDRTKIEGGY